MEAAAPPRGPYKPHEYGLVILPMTVVKRFHDCLLPTRQAVPDASPRSGNSSLATDEFQRPASRRVSFAWILAPRPDHHRMRFP